MALMFLLGFLLTIFFPDLLAGDPTKKGYEGCQKYLNYYERNLNEANLKFFMSPENESKEKILGFILGFKFSSPVSSVKVYGIRKTVKVSDKLWFVIRNETSPIEKIDFDIKFLYTIHPQIESITLNGDVVCTESFDKDHIPSLLRHPSTAQTGVLSMLIVMVLAIGIAVMILIAWVMKFRKRSKDQWYETHKIVLALERNLSPNNPNNSGVPLPPPPGFVNPKRGTYIDLRDYQCNNPECSRTYSLLLSQWKKPLSPHQSRDLVEGESNKNDEKIKEETDEEGEKEDGEKSRKEINTESS